MSYDIELEDLIIRHISENWNSIRNFRNNKYLVRDYILGKYNINGILSCSLHLDESMERYARFTHPIYGPCFDYRKYGYTRYYLECAPLGSEIYIRHNDKLLLDIEELKKIIAPMKRVKICEDGVGQVGPCFVITIEYPVEELGWLFEETQ
jgi:hypothetical protein